MLARGERPSGIPLGEAVEAMQRACAFGAERNVPMLIANAVRASVEAAANEYGPDADTGVLVAMHERMAGVVIG